MIGAIIGDIVGSVYEFDNYKAKDFQPFFHPKAFITDDTVCTIAIADILLHACDRGPDKEALVFPTGRKSYAAVTRSVLLRARGLIGLGIQPGDHVGILLPSGVEFAETLFAVAMVGGVSVLMNARLRAPEVAYVVENADLTAVITNSESDDFVDFAARLAEAFPAIATCADPLAMAVPEAPRLKRLILILLIPPAEPHQWAESLL